MFLKGVDQHTRKTGAHVDYESADLEFVCRLMYPVREVVANLVAWCRTDKTACINVLNMVVDAVKKDHNERFAGHPHVQNKAVSYATSAGDSRFFNVYTWDVLTW